MCKKAGKYKITWTIGGYDLVQVMVSGAGYQYRAKPNNTGKNTSYQTFTAEGEYVVERPTFSNATVTYDGNPHSIVVKNVPSDYKIQYSEDSTIIYKYDAEREKPIQYTDVGNYKVYCHLGKYNSSGNITEGISLSATFTILPKELELSNLKVENKKYDGTTTATVTYDELIGVIDSDDLALSTSLEWQFESADVGNNIVVMPVNYEFSGEDKDNYKLKEQSITANILPAVLKIKANDTKVDVKADIPELKYTITEGKLFNDDKITGSLFVNTDGKTEGTFDIEQGTLTAGSNYKINFTKGTLTVSDKTPQKADVSTMPEKTYGDSGFKVEVSNDQNSDLGAFTFESSNTDVATIDQDGNVTIKNAGETNIIVKRNGNDTYANFEKSQKLTVKKVEIVVTADAITKKVDTADPELTYTYTGTLVGEDTFAGNLERVAGEAIGKYDILQGTLALSDNYNLTYNKAIFEILDKTPQTITLADFEAKTYGDGAFSISVTPDTTSTLSNFTYASDNEKVATVSATGEITIVGAGEANITVTEAGNDEYAQATATKKLTVNKKAVTVTSIDLENKTAVLDGVLEADTEVSLDFDKIKLEIVGEATETTSNVLLKNFVLKGEKSENYSVTTESVDEVIENEKIVDVSVTAENGTFDGNGKYVKGSNVTVAATPNAGYRFDGWYIGDELKSTDNSYSFTAEEDVALTAKFSRIPTSSGGGGSSKLGVTFNTNGGSKVTSQRVSKNGIAKEPTAPKKEGFDFAGWYSDKDLTIKYDFSQKVTSSITLYAKWVEKDNSENEIILTIGSKKANVFGESKANDVAPIIRNDRTMLPARFVAESLGAKVEWNEEAQTVTITK